MGKVGDIKTFLGKTLSSSRYRHSLEVADLSRRLARKHRVDPKKAFIAGLVHDCAKEWSPLKMRRYAQRLRLAVPAPRFIRKNAPNMFHAYVGAAFAREKGWINDRASYHAVQAHTLGDLRMNALDKIIYIADFAAKDRKFSSAGEVRRAALKSLDVGFRLALAKKIEWNLMKVKRIHPFSLDVWNRHV